MARDLYHNNVKLALEKDGWVITHDPYSVNLEEVGYEIDLGAQPLIAAQKEERLIAIEVKSFVGPSTVSEFHKAVGQFNDYSVALEIQDPERVLFWPSLKIFGCVFSKSKLFSVHWSVLAPESWCTTLFQTLLFNG